MDRQKAFRATETDQYRIDALCTAWECGEGDAIRRAIREASERESRKRKSQLAQ